MYSACNCEVFPLVWYGRRSYNYWLQRVLDHVNKFLWYPFLEYREQLIPWHFVIRGPEIQKRHISHMIGVHQVSCNNSYRPCELSGTHLAVTESISSFEIHTCRTVNYFSRV